MDEKKTPAELVKEVRRLDAAATPGPWLARYDSGGRGVSEPDNDGSDDFLLEEGSNGTPAEVIFAARARALLPALANALEVVAAQRDGFLAQATAAQSSALDYMREAEEARAALAREQEAHAATLAKLAEIEGGRP